MKMGDNEKKKKTETGKLFKPNETHQKRITGERNPEIKGQQRVWISTFLRWKMFILSQEGGIKPRQTPKNKNNDEKKVERWNRRKEKQEEKNGKIRNRTTIF